MPAEISSRNYAIDVLKALCALLIIILHGPGPYSEFLKPVTRVGVPCFFMISGYLMFNPDICGIGERRLRNGVMKMFRLSVFVTLFFIGAKALKNGMVEHPSVQEYVKWVLFNENPFFWHLWYIHAYLYVLAILFLFDRLPWRGWIYALLPLLLIFNYALDEFYPVCGMERGIWSSSMVSRNFLFCGLPFFAIGMLIRRYSRVLLPEGTSSRLSFVYLIGFLLFMGLCYWEESLLHAARSSHRTPEIYISTTFASIFLLLFALSCRMSRSTALSRIGMNYALWIYIFHPIFIWTIMPRLNPYLPDWWNTAYYWLSPIIVFAQSVALTWLCRRAGLIGPDGMPSLPAPLRRLLPRLSKD